MAISHVFLSPQADFTGTVTIWNGSGTQTQAATDIVRPSNWNSVHNVGYILSGNTVGGSTGSGTDIIFQGGANLTLSGVGNTIVFSAAAGGGAGDGGNVLAAGTQTAASTGTVLFTNANGISFGMNNSSVITASYTVPTQSVQTQNQISVLGSTGDISFANGNGITFGGNASTITASHNGLTSQSNQAVSAGNGSSAFQTLSFADSNGVSWSTAAGGIIATVKTDYLTSQSNQALSGSNGSFTFQTATFGNLNGMSFYTSNGSLVGSYTVPTVTNSSWTVSDNATSGSVARLAFTNLNGVTLSLSSGAAGLHTIVGSHNGLTSQSNQALSASNGSFTFQTAAFSNANNVTFGTSAGSIITASVAAQSVQTQSLIAAVFDGVASISTGTIRFTNANGVSFSINGQTLSGSVAAQTAQTVGLYALGNTTQNSSTTLDARTLSFNGLGIVTAGFSNGSIQISATQSAQTLGGYAVGNTTGASSSSTVDARSFSIQGAGAASVGFTNGSWVVSAPNAAAGNVTFSAGTTSNGLANIVFSNSNGVSFGLDGSTITASVNAGGGGSLNVSAGTTSNNLTNIVFSNSNGVTFGLDGSTITASIPAPRLSSYFYPIDGGLTAISIPIQGQMSVQRLICPVNISASRYGILCSMSPVTSGDNRTFSFVASHWFGIYSDNAGTLSSMTSTSAAYTNGTWSSSNTNSANSMRQLSFAVDINMTPGVYYIMNAMSTRVISTSTSSQTVAAMNMTLHGIAVLTANNYADLGVVTNSRVNQFFSGFGLYATTTNAVPATIDLTGLNVTGTNVARANLAFIMRN